MTFAEVIRTVLEFAAVVLLIIGFFNEKKVVAFEVKLSRAIIFAIAVSVSREKKLLWPQEFSQELLKIFLKKNLFLLSSAAAQV